MNAADLVISIPIAISVIATLSVLIWKQATFQAKINDYMKQAVEKEGEFEKKANMALRGVAANKEYFQKVLSESRLSHERDLRAIEVASAKTDGKIDTILERISNLYVEFKAFKTAHDNQEI